MLGVYQNEAAFIFEANELLKIGYLPLRMDVRWLENEINVFMNFLTKR